EIHFFVKKPPKFAPNMYCYTNNDINKDLKKYLSASQFKREFTLVTGLNCVADESEFEFDTAAPNRLIVQYLDGENTRTVSKVKFVDKLEKKLWLYECGSQVDPKMAIKVGNRMPRRFKWRITDDHPRYENLMQEMLSDDNNLVIYSRYL
ncbi:hypothetical protein HAX54_013337, partial [Datura stramonium]|nr:hypothetical protein [Datura stramonium]